MDHKLTLEEVQEGLAHKRFSASEFVDALFVVIKKENPDINDFLVLNEEAARTAARESDERRAHATPRSALDGVPYAAKDVFLTKDIPTTAGSRMLEGYLPVEDATVVRRLADAGAILMGKNNCDEFAMGSSGEYSAYGPTKNPHDHSRVTGGTSSGSAAAVGAFHVPLSIGTDTNGSIRQPAAFCGVTGFKPTYGRISRYGLIALMSSADHVGPITHTPRGAAMALQAMAGADEKDATSSREPVPAYNTEGDAMALKGLRIGIPKEYFGEGLQPAIAASLTALIARLEESGARCVDLSMPHTSEALPTYYVLNPAEASSNLARYDGVRYSVQASKDVPKQLGLRERIAYVRGNTFGKEPKRRIMIGTYALSAEHRDATYRQANRVRTRIIQDFVRVFETVDVLLTPSTPTTAFPLGFVQDPIQMYLADIYTSAASLSGYPAVSIPIGMHEGLPLAAQLIGDVFTEGRLLGAAERVMELTRS